jgi:hypothetical protein
MTLLRNKFQKLYDLYKDSRIIIYDVYTYTKNGAPRVGVDYKHR